MPIITSTDQDFKDQLEKNKKVIVKFYADWCGSCKLFSPKFRRMSDSEEFKDVVFLDVNAEENSEARKAAGVDNLPFFATFKDGQLLEASATSKEEFVVEMLKKLN